MSTHACVGKQNAKKSFNKSQQRWDVYWEDEVTGKRKTSTFARWWWEVNRGDIPDGHRASYLDENPLNIDPDNIVLISKEEFGNRISERLMGHGFSEEALQKMSNAKIGKPLSEEHKAYIGKATKQMWKDGVFDVPEIRASFVRQGKSTKGSKRTPEQIDKMVVRNKANPRISQMFTPKAIEKRRQKVTGVPKSDDFKKKVSLSMIGREFSDEHRDNLSKANKKREDLKGANSRWWKGGIAYDPYPDTFSKYYKSKIRRRDNFTCQSCGTNVFGSRAGHVHHIDADKQNCKDDNLILLCAACHNAVHKRNSLKSDKISELQSKLKY